MNLRIATAGVLLSLIVGWVPASAALVTYVFTGNASVGIGSDFFSNVDYTIVFSIDSPGTDLIEDPAGREFGFGSGQAWLTLENKGAGGATGVINALSQNITGIKFKSSLTGEPKQQVISLVSSPDFNTYGNQWHVECRHRPARYSERNLTVHRRTSLDRDQWG